MTKKMLRLLLCTVVGLSLGCSDDDDSGEDSGNKLGISKKAGDLTDYSICSDFSFSGSELSNFSWYSSGMVKGYRQDSILEVNGEKITYTVFCFDEDEVIEKKHSAPISLDAGKITIDQEFTAIGNSPKLPPDCEVPFKKGAVLKYKFVGACLELTREDDTRFVRVPMTDRLTGVGGSVANNN